MNFTPDVNSPTPWRVAILKTVVAVKDANGNTVANLPITGVCTRQRRIADAKLLVARVNSSVRTADVIPLITVQRVPQLSLVP